MTPIQAARHSFTSNSTAAAAHQAPAQGAVAHHTPEPVRDRIALPTAFSQRPSAMGLPNATQVPQARAELQQEMLTARERLLRTHLIPGASAYRGNKLFATIAQDLLEAGATLTNHEDIAAIVLTLVKKSDAAVVSQLVNVPAKLRQVVMVWSEALIKAVANNTEPAADGSMPMHFGPELTHVAREALQATYACLQNCRQAAISGGGRDADKLVAAQQAIDAALTALMRREVALVG